MIVSSNNFKFINWSGLKNPVYSHFGWSVKDACMAYREGIFYLFFSAFYRDRGRERSHVVGVTTRDWFIFSKPFLHIDGREQGWTGMCSPDIALIDGIYYLTFNSWGEEHPNGQKNQLFYISSPDLIQWSDYHQIGKNLTENIRCIDISIAKHNGAFYIMWKDESIRVPRKKYMPRIAKASALESDWWFIGDGYPHYFLSTGLESRFVHENYQFLRIDSKQYLLSLDYAPHHPVLYEIGGNPNVDESWLRWVNGKDLVVPKERFNRAQRSNAPFLADWRGFDGYFYMLYAGRTHALTHAGRGNNKLGLARSPDLTDWAVP
jgi:hypothetical protein